MAIVMAGNKDGGKILMLNSEGEWVFPKGHVEDGETYIAAAVRELKEEADVDIRQEDCIGQVDEFSFYFDGEKAKKVIKVFGFVTSKEQKITYNQNECFIDGQWVDISSAIEKLKHDDAKNALRKFLEKV